MSKSIHKENPFTQNFLFSENPVWVGLIQRWWPRFLEGGHSRIRRISASQIGSQSITASCFTQTSDDAHLRSLQ